MNTLITLFLTILAISNCDKKNIRSEVVNNNNPSLTIIFMNDHREKPIITDKNYFWNSKYLDTIQIFGNMYREFVINNIKNLKKESINYDFTINVALTYKNGEGIDTVYSDNFFRNWLIGNTNYIDSNQNIRKMFEPLYLGYYGSVDKIRL